MSTRRDKPPAGPAAGFEAWWLTTPLLAAAGLFALDRTNFDQSIVRWFYDAGAQTFPLRHTFLVDIVMHHWAKYLVTTIALLVIAVLLLSYVIKALRPRRRSLLFLALALVLAPATVSALKLTSARHCPWDLAEFGGFAPYTGWFEPLSSLAPGHCFPAGHAATGFALLAFYFAGRAWQRRDIAIAGLASGLLGGIVLGGGRVAQGAHFPSHVLWSGIVCWLVMVCLYLGVLHNSTVTAQCE
jgi:membrane-associated PAP2 superfamily phosphatase